MNKIKYKTIEPNRNHTTALGREDILIEDSERIVKYKTAKELFGDLGLCLTDNNSEELYYVKSLHPCFGIFDQVIFYLERKTYFCEFHSVDVVESKKIFDAINKQLEELKW